MTSHRAPTTNGRVIEATGLCKTYSGRRVVTDANLHVNAGEIVGFLGPNGAGKTTTLGMLTGVVVPDAGTVLLGGRQLGRAARSTRSLLGVVPQGIALYPTLTAMQNLRFFADAQGVHRADRNDAIRWALDVVGLADRAKETVANFSGGMQRRLNIACGIVHSPQLLVLDEPTVGVDPQSRERIFACIRRLREELEMAVIYTSHYMPEVQDLCDRIAVMDSGVVIAEGTLDSLLSPLGAGILWWRLALEGIPVDDLLGELTATLEPRGRLEIESCDEEIIVTLAADEVSGTLHALVDLEKRLSLTVTGLRIERPSLETLFLSMTGRELRDGE